MIKRIERRISIVTHLPEVNGEGLQILHYESGQKYEAHHDFFHDKFNSRPENGGQRIATVLMYLCARALLPLCNISLLVRHCLSVTASCTSPANSSLPS